MSTKQNKVLVTLFELACGSSGATTIKAVRKNFGEPCSVKELALTSAIPVKRLNPILKSLVKKDLAEATTATEADIGAKANHYRITAAGLDALDAGGLVKEGSDAVSSKVTPTPKPDKKVTRKDRVRAMLVTGVSIEQITNELKCSKQAAHSLLGDLRREGVKMTRERLNDVNRWTLV